MVCSNKIWCSLLHKTFAGDRNFSIKELCIGLLGVREEREGWGRASCGGSTDICVSSLQKWDSREGREGRRKKSGSCVSSSVAE